MKKTNNISIAALLLAFFVMSFVDMVGVATDYVKADMQLPDGLVQFISFAAFLWFFVLSVPTGILQARYGKRNILVLGIIISAIGLILPFAIYSFASVLIGFSLLGIGNTILQVSANPLLIQNVAKEQSSSYMSFSQFIKAVGSMAAAPATALIASATGNWKLVFVLFAVVSAISAVFLYNVDMKDDKSSETNTSFASCFKLLNNRFVLYMVLGIFLVVGIDVGINVISGQFLMERFNMEQAVASSGRSLYFMGKLTGSLLGAILLTRFDTRSFFIATAILLIISILGFAFNPMAAASWVILFFIGLFGANIFPIIFTLSINALPLKANEISGLMMMAISGGAIIPPMLGFLSGVWGNIAGLFLLVACSVILLFIGYFNKQQSEA